MTDRILARILRERGLPTLLDVLAHDLPPTDLLSLLLAVFHRRARHQTARRVLEAYRRDPFVRLATVSPRDLLELDQLALSCAEPAFTALELAPLAPLGTSSALAPVDQNRVVTTIRNTEVVSDSTNVLALECALRRRAQRREPGVDGPVHLCASQRLVRAQHYTAPNMRAHFRMFSLCTAGRAAGATGFETAALLAQLTFHLSFMKAATAAGYHLARPRVAFTPLADDRAQAALEAHVLAPLSVAHPTAHLVVDPDTATTRGYYQWVRFQIYAADAQGSEHMIGDGGFTTWTQQLLSDHRERLLTSGIATERIAMLFRPHAAR